MDSQLRPKRSRTRGTADVVAIDGEALHTLCVYEERSVRTPREAQRLLRDGCEHRGRPSLSLVLLLQALREISRLSLVSLEHHHGRLVVRTSCKQTHLDCRHLVECYGLSWFDGGRTRAWLERPSRLELARCCALLKDRNVASLELSSERLCLTVRAHDAELRLIAQSGCARHAAGMRLLGFSPVARVLIGTRSVSMAQAPELLLRCFKVDEQPVQLRVSLHGARPVSLVR